MAGDNLPAPGRQGPWQPGKPPRGNTWAVKHGAYSDRKVGQRAELIRVELIEAMPYLDDAELIVPVVLLTRALAREELAHAEIEDCAAGGKPISPRLLEAANTAARVAKELADSLGIGPRAAAELRQIGASAALTLSQLRQAPDVLEAMDAALVRLGHADEVEQFHQLLGEELRRQR